MNMFLNTSTALDWWLWYLCHLIHNAGVNIMRLSDVAIHHSKVALSYKWMKELNKREKDALFELYQDLYKEHPMILPYDYYVSDNMMTIMDHGWYVTETPFGVYVKDQQIDISYNKFRAIQQKYFN